MGEERFLRYKPTRTQEHFHNDKSFTKAIAGPPGGGKSVACLMEAFFRCWRQPPNAAGVRQFRLLIVRDTYPQLNTTVRRTIEEWFPKEFGQLKGTMPIEGMYRIPLPDNTLMELEIFMMSVDEDTLIKLQSMEISAAWINEAASTPKAVFDKLIERVGRFPAVKNGVPCAEPGVWVDFNLPGKDHWLYKYFVHGPRSMDVEIEKPDGTKKTIQITNSFFAQPPAVFIDNLRAVDDGKELPKYRLNPHAENLENLTEIYYAQQLIAAPTRDEWAKIKAFLGMIWTTRALGKLVYGTDFAFEVHVSPSVIEPEPVGTIVGIDTSGLHPCAVFVQLRHGCAVVTDEVYGDGVGFELFITDLLQPTIATRYAGSSILAVCDFANAREARTGFTPVQLLQANNINAIIAPTNKFELRKQAVASLLARRNGLLISAHCEQLISGFQSTYVHKLLRGSSDVAPVYSPSPDKTQPASHYHDALQYAALHIVAGSQTRPLQPVSDDLKNRFRPRPFI